MRIVGYLDAGTGSMIVGAIAAGGASVAVAGKAMLRKIGLRKKGAEFEAPEPQQASGAGEQASPVVES